MALFKENGPYFVHDDLSLTLNPYSCTSLNMVHAFSARLMGVVSSLPLLHFSALLFSSLLRREQQRDRDLD